LGLTRQDDDDDAVARQCADALGDDSFRAPPLVSADVVYKNELKSGEYLTWEVSLGHDFTTATELRPSILFRRVGVESDDVGAKWVGERTRENKSTTEISKTGEASGEDDFQVTSGNGGKGASKDEESETENIRFAAEILLMSPLIGFQPCPLVFFRDRWGDYEIFRFLWFRMPHHLPPLKLERTTETHTTTDLISEKISSMSVLTWPGEAIPGGFAAKAWAFMTLSGDRVLCIYAESDSHSSPGKQALYFRGDCKSALYGLVGPQKARSAAVTALVPGMIPV
jgi:hypothetical protein